jgi:hypothetical protein
MNNDAGCGCIGCLLGAGILAIAMVIVGIVTNNLEAVADSLRIGFGLPLALAVILAIAGCIALVVIWIVFRIADRR